ARERSLVADHPRRHDAREERLGCAARAQELQDAGADPGDHPERQGRGLDRRTDSDREHSQAHEALQSGKPRSDDPRDGGRLMPVQEDSGLLALRAEFVATFDERKTELDSRLSELARLRSQGRPGEAREACLAIHVVAHRLAGAAATYGLVALGSIAEALDDVLGEELREGRAPALDLLPGRAAVLSRAL